MWFQRGTNYCLKSVTVISIYIRTSVFVSDYTPNSCILQVETHIETLWENQWNSMFTSLMWCTLLVKHSEGWLLTVNQWQFDKGRQRSAISAQDEDWQAGQVCQLPRHQQVAAERSSSLHEGKALGWLEWAVWPSCVWERPDYLVQPWVSVSPLTPWTTLVFLLQLRRCWWISSLHLVTKHRPV